MAKVIKGNTPWKEYVDELVASRLYPPKMIIEMAGNEFPTISVTSIKEYTNSVCDKDNRSGYACPKCGSFNTTTKMMVYHTDFVMRSRKCRCGKIWRTIELDEDMFNNLTGVGNK